jgi:PAS domain S-box-containing protein
MPDVPPVLADRLTSAESLVAIDHAGNIVLMTPAAEELFGVAFDDIAGEPVEFLVDSEVRFGHQAYRRGFLAEPAHREMDPGLEPKGERLDTGEKFRVHIDLEPVRNDEGTLFVVAHVTTTT